MIKKAITVSIIAFAVIGAVMMLYQTADLQPMNDSPENENVAVDIVMPTKVSRPGCEETDSCYVPATITVKVGQPVTWLNEDSAFHSVTSGTYDIPTDDFDSGYMDPYQSFTLTFEQAGTVDYFCTLHPWMAGRVVVES